MYLLLHYRTPTGGTARMPVIRSLHSAFALQRAVSTAGGDSVVVVVGHDPLVHFF